MADHLHLDYDPSFLTDEELEPRQIPILPNKAPVLRFGQPLVGSAQLIASRANCVAYFWAGDSH